MKKITLLLLLLTLLLVEVNSQSDHRDITTFWWTFMLETENDDPG